MPSPTSAPRLPTGPDRRAQRYRRAKRAIDLAVGLSAAPPAVAVVAVAAVGAVLTQGRPVFFVQERVGLHAQPFRLVKLRTMTTAPPPEPTVAGPVPGRAYREKARITPYGRVLRRLKIDELPQLVNLIAGDLSLVGPRPLLPAHVALVDGGGLRHTVRPGLTCLAQLELMEHGYLDRHRQVRLDEEYVARLGPRLDLAILLRTLALGLGRSGRPSLALHEPEAAGVRPPGFVPGGDPPGAAA